MKKFVVFILFFVFVGNSSALGSTDNFGNQIPENYLPFSFSAGSFAPDPNFSVMPKKYSGVYPVASTLPICKSVSDTDCIVNVEYIDSGGNVLPGKFQGYVPVSYKGPCTSTNDAEGYKELCLSTEPYFTYDASEISYPAQIKRKIPKSSRGSIWVFPGMESNGERKYLVSFKVWGEMTNHNSPLAEDSYADWNTGGAGAYIVPISISNGGNGETLNSDNRSLFKTSNQSCYPNSSPESIYCLTKITDESSPRFRLTVRLELTSSFLLNRNWQISKTLNPTITSKIAGKITTLTYSGNMTKVWSATALIPKTLSGYKLFIDATNQSYKDSGVTNKPLDSNDLSGFENWLKIGSAGTNGSDPSAIGFFSGISDKVEIRSAKVDYVWMFESANVSGTDVGWLWPCAKTPQLSGVTSSNATILRPTPPKWNSVDSTLEFKIGSPHFDEKNTVISGFYNITVSEEVAKCLWGVQATLASAKVSIISDSGEKKLTTFVTNKKDGYINFQVNGFDYSVNTIKISLDKVQASKIPKNSSLGSITCINNKKVIRVIKAGQKCPTGFKKK